MRARYRTEVKLPSQHKEYSIVDLLANDYANLPQLMEFVDFVRSSERGLCPAEKNVEKKH